MRCGCFWSRITGSHLVSDKADPDRGCRYTDAGGVLRLQKIGEARAYENRDREKPQGGINGRRAVLQLGDRIAAEHLAYAFRNAADILVAIVNFADSCRKRNRIDRLNHAFRHIRASACACVAVSVLSVAA